MKKHFELCFALILLAMLLSVPALSDEQVQADGRVPVVGADGPELSAPADQEKNEGFDDEFDEEEEVEISDPYEGFNRTIFWFNDRFYFIIFKPVTRVYRFVLPEPVRLSVGNVFSNLRTPISVVNSLLQFKLKDAGNDTLRFLINSTIGLLGLFDPAYTLMGIKPKKEDFDQTLGVWGLGEGDYLVLPFLGGAGTRGSIGRIIDIFFYPLTYSSLNTPEQVGLWALEGVNELSIDRDTYEAIKKQSLDPYIFIRNSYYQRREGLKKH